jgi:lysophospholipase L1-like esterase
MLKDLKGVQGWLPCHRRIIVSLSLACLLLLAGVPEALAASSANSQASSLVGPKQYYLALGDSLAFGYQPDFDFFHGYADDFFRNLQSHGVKSLANMGCPGESSQTFIHGGCPHPYLRKFPYLGPQLSAAVSYLRTFAGQVSPVTLDIGSNDLLPDFDPSTCTLNVSEFHTDLATLDSNLKGTILPALQAALTVHGRLTGDLVLMNYYDPYQNRCPNTVSYVQTVNAHLANDVSGFGIIVDVFGAFGGATTPNPNICTYTWMCSIFKDIHATDTGYSVIATTFEQGTGY